MSKNWHCARTKHAQERRAAIEIANQGFHVFFPVRQVTVCHAGRRETAPRPLFSRYLFVEFDSAPLWEGGDDWGVINHTRGVSRLLSDMGGNPQPIRAAVIDAIRKRETEEKLNSGELKSGYNPGDVFELPVGPFAGIPATYLSEEKGTATVIVKLFGREFLKEVPLSQLPFVGSGSVWPDVDPLPFRQRY